MTQTNTRLIWLDLLRAVAIAAMVVFHFTFDLMYFGYIQAGTVFQPEWRMFERAIAISFLFLAGLSWQHTHREGIKWLTLWRRVAVLGAAATGISIVTYYTFGSYMIRFGILHLILVMCLLSIPLLSLHWGVPLTLAAALGSYFIWADGPVNGSVWLMWIIWTTETAGSVDYRPIMPWGFAFFAACVRMLCSIALTPFPMMDQQAPGCAPLPLQGVTVWHFTCYTNQSCSQALIFMGFSLLPDQYPAQNKSAKRA